MINAMMEILREEFAQELPETRKTLSLWRSAPNHLPETIVEMQSLFERLLQAMQTMGLDGLSGYLQFIQAFTHELVDNNYALNSDLNTYLSGSSTTDTNAVMHQHALGVHWLYQWVDEVSAYLDKPADGQTVEDMVVYLAKCPKPFDEEQILEVAALLLTLPSMNDEDAEELELLQIPASDEDVALPTEDVDPELLHALLVDAPQQLDELEHTVTEWAAGVCSEDDMQEALRCAHTLKGSGAIIGLPGIARLAHRLEDILEYAFAGLQMRPFQSEVNRPSETLSRDVLQAVHCLQQMVSYLQGNEDAPTHAKFVLQNLLDWAKLIHSGDIDSFDDSVFTLAELPAELLAADISESPSHLPLPIEQAHNAVNFVSTETPTSTPTPTAPIQNLTLTSPVRQQDAASLRLSVNQLSRLLRRAGQSIVHTERLFKLLSDTQSWLAAMERSNQVMTARLRELDAMVNSQVVQLRDAQVGALQSAQADDSNFDPLELDRYDALHGLSRFIGEAARDSSAMMQQARESTAQSVDMLLQESYALTEQHRELLAARMVPVKTIIPRLKRTVAQTAIATQRKVALLVTGEDVVIDSDVLSRLVEPLLHLLRNAVDHGIELPHTRLELDKPEQGTIRLEFQRVGEEMVLRVSDDGRGLDLEAITAKAINYGLIESVHNLSETELQHLILQPGFSTRDAVTETSGRGVGMDIVNDRIIGLKGRLAIQSTFGSGSTFTVHVPVTSGMAHALVVQSMGQSVALPLEHVDSIVAAGLGQFSLVHDELEVGIKFEYEGQTYSTYLLAQWLNLDDASTTDICQRAPSLIVVLAKGIYGPVALLVNAVLESRELILKDIGLLSRRVRGVIGCALRPDGRPLFMLSVIELQRAVAQAATAAKQSRLSARSASTTTLRKRLQVERTRVLVVDDAWSVRRSMQQLLEDAGYDVATAADGFEALERLRAKLPAVVLTDLEMPNLNGLELARRMKEIPQWAAIPVVMITSRTSAKHRNEGLKAGVDVYLTKPYQDADLLAQVRNLTTVKTTVLAVF